MYDPEKSKKAVQLQSGKEERSKEGESKYVSYFITRSSA